MEGREESLNRETNNNTKTLVQSHLGGDVDEPLVDKEADVLGEEVGDILQHLSVPALGRLLQQESPGIRQVRNNHCIPFVTIKIGL